MATKEISVSRPLVLPATRHWRRNLWQVLCLPLLLFIFFPLLAIFLRLSPGDFLRVLGQESAWMAIRLSLMTTFATVGLTLLAGTPLAYYLHRRRSRASWVVDTLVDLPTVLPPAVAGVALLMAFGRRGLLGEWLNELGINLPFTMLAVILAQTFIAAPLYIRTAALGFAGVDCELKKAAALDGANRWQTFRYIMVPMTGGSLLSGAVMTWSRALAEFGATIIFAGSLPGRTQTMPLAIYIGFEIQLEVALTLSALLIGISVLVLVLVKNMLHSPTVVCSEDFD